MSQHVRLVQDDDSSISLEAIFSEYCNSHGTSVLDPIMFCLKKRFEYKSQPQVPNRDIRRELFEEVRRAQVPATVLSDFARKALPDFASHWVFRTNFTRQLATISFATRVLFLHHGAPGVINIQFNNGDISYMELYPCFDDGVVASTDRVFFRLTPNLVRFMNSEGATGAFAISLSAAANVINDPDFRISDFFSAFFRDEVISMHSKPGVARALDNEQLTSKVNENVSRIMDRLSKMAVVDSQMSLTDSLIRNATLPSSLSQMPPTWHPWL